MVVMFDPIAPLRLAALLTGCGLFYLGATSPLMMFLGCVIVPKGRLY